jgi:thioredoxin-like negative regulator of GroEL
VTDRLEDNPTGATTSEANSATGETKPTEQSKPRLLFFFEPTDGYTRRLEAHLASVLQRRHNHDTFLIHRIDVQQRPDLAKRFRIEQTPTLCVVDNRRVALRAHRPRGAPEIQRLLAPWLQSTHPRFHAR